MRILVLSDTHGDDYNLRRAVASQPEAKIIFHLGDGAREAQSIAGEYPDRQFHIVCGNGDFGCTAFFPDAGVEIAAGRRIFYTHGHHYDVKTGLYRVVCAARERKANILLFGHTHIPLCEYEGGLYILNPGSLTYRRPTYGIVDITPSGIVTNILELRL